MELGVNSMGMGGDG